MEEKKKTRMYYYDLMQPGLKRVAKEIAEERITIFIKAPSKKSIMEAGVKIVEGDCVNHEPTENIEFGKIYNFRAGDPVEFRGLAVEIVLLANKKHLKIIVGDKKEVEVYSFEIENEYCYLEIIP